MTFELEKRTSRDIYGDLMLELAREDPDVVGVTGDSQMMMRMTKMAAEFPDRVFNVGIAEQNAMDMAAGLAAAGLKPFVAGFAPFMTMRACEQLRTFICYPNLNVNVVGGMGGLSASTEGVTHMGLEDIGIVRTFPHMVAAAPADAESAYVIGRELYKYAGPTYMKIFKGAVYKVFDRSTYKFEIGKANLLREGTDVTIIANGPLVALSMLACEELAGMGINARLLEMPCVKPIDREAIVAAARDTGLIVTAEDHQIYCGLGSAVTEVLCDEYPVPCVRMGVQDTFAESGDHYDLLKKYGLGTDSIVATVAEAVKTKKK